MPWTAPFLSESPSTLRSSPALWQDQRALKVYGADNQELLTITALEREGSALVIRGNIFGMMPLVAKLQPEEARAALRMLGLRTAWFVLTLPFRRRSHPAQRSE